MDPKTRDLYFVGVMNGNGGRILGKKVPSGIGLDTNYLGFIAKVSADGVTKVKIWQHGTSDAPVLLLKGQNLYLVSLVFDQETLVDLDHPVTVRPKTGDNCTLAKWNAELDLVACRTWHKEARIPKIASKQAYDFPLELGGNNKEDNYIYALVQSDVPRARGNSEKDWAKVEAF